MQSMALELEKSYILEGVKSSFDIPLVGKRARVNPENQSLEVKRGVVLISCSSYMEESESNSTIKHLIIRLSARSWAFRFPERVREGSRLVKAQTHELEALKVNKLWKRERQIFVCCDAIKPRWRTAAMTSEVSSS